MVAFAGNSLLCRLALQGRHIDAASFTGIRLASGAALLSCLAWSRGAQPLQSGSWASALALFLYAAGFSFAYLSLPAGTGALLLFGAVQATMILFGLWRGERLQPAEWTGFVIAIAGLIGLLAPGVHAAPLGGSMLMVLAGIAWGAYSIRGRSSSDPVLTTAGNFLRAAPMVLVLPLFGTGFGADATGIALAVASGALASGVGYVIWYAAVRHLRTANAAVVQLSVPVIAAAGGFALIGESITLRYVLAAGAILGGILLALRARSSPAGERR
jgi:drug/metabolite transporter (DMT)-like permease